MPRQPIITDVKCAHPKPEVPFYGAYPAGFLGPARHLLAANIGDPVLHVCSGVVRSYPYDGVGPNDKTLDLDPALKPDFVRDAREPFPSADSIDDMGGTIGTSPFWRAVMIDPPYSPEDADHYAVGRVALPSPRQLVLNALDVVDVGSKVGILHYYIPQIPAHYAFVCGEMHLVLPTNSNIRVFTVFERLS